MESDIVGCVDRVGKNYDTAMANVIQPDERPESACPAIVPCRCGSVDVDYVPSESDAVAPAIGIMPRPSR